MFFNHGRDNISISHHMASLIALWSVKFTGHLSILLDIFSTVFRHEDGAIWKRTQNLFPCVTVRVASMVAGKKTNLNNALCSSLNSSNARSNPWRRSVKWLSISSRLSLWPPSSHKETAWLSLKTKKSASIKRNTFSCIALKKELAQVLKMTCGVSNDGKTSVLVPDEHLEHTLTLCIAINSKTVQHQLWLFFDQCYKTFASLTDFRVGTKKH